MARYTCLNPSCGRTTENAWMPVKTCPHCKGTVLRPEVTTTVPSSSQPVVRTVVPIGKATTSKPPGKATIPTPTQTSSGKALTVAMPPHPLLLSDILVQLFELFDERSVGLLARVCRRWHHAATIVLRRYVADARGFGSGSGLTMKSQILGLLANTRNLSLAVDKFMPISPGDGGSILAYIVKHQIKLTLKLGTPNPKLQEQLLKASQDPTFIYKYAEIRELRRRGNEPALLDYESEDVTQFGGLKLKLPGRHIQTGLMHNKF